jgi:ribosomal protein S18 acetylase RimI-like enzyme/2'-5' RNA ligase
MEKDTIGIVSLLTGSGYLVVRRAQRQLYQSHGLSMEGFVRPHVTYAVGTLDGELEALSGRLAALAAETDPFTIQVVGLGIFPGVQPVLYLPVPRGPQLAALHRRVCDHFRAAGGELEAFYELDGWLPHVTLTTHGLTNDGLPAALADLPAPCLNLKSRLIGLCLAQEVAPGRWEKTIEFSFRGVDTLGPNRHGLTSRPCQPWDRDVVYRLVEETMRPIISAHVEWDQERFDRDFDASWRQKQIILLNGRPVGYVQPDRSADDHLYIAGLILDPAVQGQGLGSWLLGHMERLAEGRPVRLHVWENNPAVAFYRRHGYQVVLTEGHKHLMEKRIA